jgi:hypothetical protein
MILLHDLPNSGGAVPFSGGAVCNDSITFISSNVGALIHFGGTCL